MLKRTLISTLVASFLLAGCGGDEDSGSGSNANQIRQATLSLQRANISLDEGGEGERRQAVLQLRASNNVQGAVTVRVQTSDGSAVAGKDYEPLDTTVTLANGQRQIDVPVTIIGNAIYQSDRDFTVQFSVEDGGRYATINGELEGRVTIKDDDPKPVIGFVDELTQVHESIGTIALQVRQTGLSAFDSEVSFSLSGLATQNVDYRIDQASVVIPAMQTESSLLIQIIEDDVIEGTEDIRIALGNAKHSTIAGARDALHPSSTVLILGDLRLPDTGVVHYYNEGDLKALLPDGEHPNQDADYGLDTDDRFIGNGQAGFYLIKIDDAGNAMPASSTANRCVYDAHTGLTWEVKTPSARFVDMDDGMDGLNERLIRSANDHWQAANNRYMWRNSNTNENAGSAGGSNSNELLTNAIPVSNNCRYPTPDSPGSVGGYRTHGCTTDKFVDTLNKVGRCGFNDWRKPSIQELMTIMSYQDGRDVLDQGYFHDQGGAFAPPYFVYWSATPSVDNDASAWCYDTSSNRVRLCNKRDHHHVRLVRGPKL